MHYSAEVKNKLRFMREVMGLLPGGLMSLEGNLRKACFDDRLLASRKPIGKLKRDTFWPRLDFLVIRLEPTALDDILTGVAAVGLEKEDDGILHVYMERNGAIEFAAHDWYDGCAVIGHSIPVALLEKLQLRGVVDSFRPEPGISP